MAVASIVDYLKSKGQDSSYNSRKNLASQYGITGYTGSATQNTNLLKAIQGQSSQPQQNQANGSNAVITPVTSSSPGHPATDYLTGYQYNKYRPSDRVNNYADRLEDLENNKPGDFVSKYDSQIDSIVNNILNREQFDPNSVYDTDLYKNYREQYMQQGNKAMRDTIGNISGMTGGYGSTYATAAGQQAYDGYLSQLGDKTMDIYDRVYQQYLNEGQELYNQLGMVNNQDNIDYSRYRDTVGDYYNDLNYYAGRYDSSYAQDFGEYQYGQDAQRWAEEYAYQKTQDALAQSNWQTQFDYQKQQDALDYALKQQQLAASRSRGGSGGGSKKTSNTKSQAQTVQKQATLGGRSYFIYDTRQKLEKNASNADVMQELYDRGVSDDEVKKIMKAAGGDYEEGLREAMEYAKQRR